MLSGLGLPLRHESYLAMVDRSALLFSSTKVNHHSPSKTAALVCAVVHVLPISFNAATMVLKSFLACERRSPSSFGLSEMPSSTAEMARTVPQQKAALVGGVAREVSE